VKATAGSSSPSACDAAIRNTAVGALFGRRPCSTSHRIRLPRGWIHGLCSPTAQPWPRTSPDAAPQRTRRTSLPIAIPTSSAIRPRMARFAASLASCAFPMAGSAGVVVDPRSSRSVLQCTGLAAHARGGCRRPPLAHLCVSQSEGGDTSSPAPASLTTPSSLLVPGSDTCARIYSEVAPPAGARRQRQRRRPPRTRIRTEASRPRSLEQLTVGDARR
jgi:hypothetical protein